MNRRKPSIHVHHSQKSLGCDDYAYYDGGKNEIHILDKDILFSTVMRHELYHASKGLRWLDGLEILRSPLWAIVFISTSLILVSIMSTILSLLGGVYIAMGIVTGALIVTVLGSLDYSIEELKAKRAETDDKTLVPTATLP